MRDATALWANAHIVIGARKFTAGAPEVAACNREQSKVRVRVVGPLGPIDFEFRRL